MSRTVDSYPVKVVNQPVPSLDPFMAILYAQFLERKVWLEPFVFSAIWDTLSSGASGEQRTTTIDPNIDFVVQAMNLSCYKTDDTYVPTPQLLLEVTEQSGRANWQDQAINVGNWFGQTRSGAISFIWPTPRYVRGNNTIQFKMTNLDALAYRVDLALIGMRVTYLKVSREELFNIPF